MENGSGMGWNIYGYTPYGHIVEVYYCRSRIHSINFKRIAALTMPFLLVGSCILSEMLPKALGLM